jgi:hypothetical protein
MRDTIEMAREAGLLTWLKPPEDVIERFKAFEALVRADERERMYGKDIDTLLFEEHRLGFEKGSRSEREACYTIAKFNQSNHLEHLTADQIKARGETK